ncbi:transposase [Amycolatopsis sp. NPDC006125]|uniref:transposase n=1 Tax=Amycolatopsis sp. NPDC006125 TaxID=3156730 RepID=UPI0033ACEBB1
MAGIELVVSRCELLSDEQWALIENLLPVRPGRPFPDARAMMEGIICRYRSGIAGRDVPAVFGTLPATAGAAGEIDWNRAA